MTTLDFLGTGNFSAPGRYWNSFVLDGTVLVEPSPTALPNLRRCGLGVQALDAVVISHFHADHTFGWPFLLLEIVLHRDDRPLFVVGPRGVEQFLTDMLELGGVPNIRDAAAATANLRFVEVDPRADHGGGAWQEAGALRFQAVEVEHVDDLDCYGYLFERDGRVVGYSGDTRPCAGLTTLATASDVLVVECNGAHQPPPVPVTHMDRDAIRELRAAHPDTPFVLTHLGEDVDVADLGDTRVPNDFDRIEV
ncbi:MAG TPA: MBL fold metallo-hydrolase [Acidimicrobiales bacterium]